MLGGPKRLTRLPFIAAALVAIAGSLAVAESSVAAATLTPAARGKKVTHNCVGSTKRPAKIILACGDGNAQLRKLRWRSWGNFAAKGRGNFRVNTCRPDCARGRFKSFPVRVRLSRARPCGGGLPHYRRGKITFKRKKPAFMNRSERNRLFCPF